MIEPRVLNDCFLQAVIIIVINSTVITAVIILTVTVIVTVTTVRTIPSKLPNTQYYWVLLTPIANTNIHTITVKQCIDFSTNKHAYSTSLPILRLSK